MNKLDEPVYWKGRQWAITSFGLETIDEPYHYWMEGWRDDAIQF
jgi:hypothetical protein